MNQPSWDADRPRFRPSSVVPAAAVPAARHRESTQVDRRRTAKELAAAAILIVSVVVPTWAMVALADEPLEPCTSTSTSACSGPIIEHDTNGGVYDSVSVCPTEDSVGCRWDASEQGNGEGYDVLNPPTELP